MMKESYEIESQAEYKTQRLYGNSLVPPQSSFYCNSINTSHTIEWKSTVKSIYYSQIKLLKLYIYIWIILLLYYNLLKQNPLLKCIK